MRKVFRFSADRMAKLVGSFETPFLIERKNAYESIPQI
jgi:hypothetical protein